MAYGMNGGEWGNFGVELLAAGGWMMGIIYVGELWGPEDEQVGGWREWGED